MTDDTPTARRRPMPQLDPDSTIVVCAITLTGVLVYIALATHRQNRRHRNEVHAQLIARYQPAATSAQPDSDELDQPDEPVDIGPLLPPNVHRMGSPPPDLFEGEPDAGAPSGS